MTHDIKQLSVQALSALLALRYDTINDTTKELQQLLDECEAIRNEIARRQE